MERDGTQRGDERGDATHTEAVSPETDIDPKAFLKALLGINADDAERVRDSSPATRERTKGQGEPVHDYGEG
jgi:hypothetical protein